MICLDHANHWHWWWTIPCCRGGGQPFRGSRCRWPWAGPTSRGGRSSWCPTSLRPGGCPQASWNDNFRFIWLLSHNLAAQLSVSFPWHIFGCVWCLKYMDPCLYLRLFCFVCHMVYWGQQYSSRVLCSVLYCVLFCFYIFSFIYFGGLGVALQFLVSLLQKYKSCFCEFVERPHLKIILWKCFKSCFLLKWH